MCVGLYAESGVTPSRWEYGDEKTGINWLNGKRSLIPWGLKSADLENKFLFVKHENTQINLNREDFKSCLWKQTVYVGTVQNKYWKKMPEFMQK